MHERPLGPCLEFDSTPTPDTLLLLPSGIGSPESSRGCRNWPVWPSGRGDGGESDHSKYPGWQFWWRWARAGYLFKDLDPLLKFH